MLSNDALKTPKASSREQHVLVAWFEELPLLTSCHILFNLIIVPLINCWGRDEELLFIWFDSIFFGAKWRDEDGTFHLCSGQISSLTTWPMHISSGCRPRSTYIPSTRNMLDIVLGAQAWGDVAEVHLFGDYLNLHGHSIAARGERRAREGKGRHKRTWNQWRGEKRKRR